jgi:hypothetical protein
MTKKDVCAVCVKGAASRSNRPASQVAHILERCMMAIERGSCGLAVAHYPSSHLPKPVGYKRCLFKLELAVAEA